MAQRRHPASHGSLLAVALALEACTTLTGRPHGAPVPPGASVTVEDLVAADRLALDRVRSEVLPNRHAGPLPRGETEELTTSFSDDRCGGPCQMTRAVAYASIPLLVVVALPVVLAAEVLGADAAAATDPPVAGCARADAAPVDAAAAPPAAWLFGVLTAAPRSSAPVDRYPHALQAALRAADAAPNGGSSGRTGTPATLQAGLWRAALLREPAGDLLLLCSRAVVNVGDDPPRHFETCLTGRYCPALADASPGEAERLRAAVNALARTLALRQARALAGAGD